MPKITIEIDTDTQAVVPREILDRFPEINLSNYGHYEACRLNEWGVELVLAAAPQPEQAQQPAPRPVPTSDWISLAEKAPDCLEVRIKLLDGSEINCWAQSDGDFYWKSGSGEIFIREHDVTHWLPTGLVRPAEVKP